jgi:anti-sigma factor RsiW
MKVTCKEIRPYLSRYRDSELDTDVQLREKTRSHLAECQDCSRELLLLDEITENVRHLPEVEPAPNFTAQVMARVLEKERNPRWRLLPSLVYSFVFIVFCLLGLMLNPSLKKEAPEPVKISDYSTVLVESQQLSLLEVQDKSLDLVYNEE